MKTLKKDLQWLKEEAHPEDRLVFAFAFGTFSVVAFAVVSTVILCALKSL